MARILALAHHFQGLITRGEARDKAHLARLVEVSRVRITQIMNPLFLAPDIQEAVLHLPRTPRGEDPIRGRALRRIAAEPDWSLQRPLWRELLEPRGQP